VSIVLKSGSLNLLEPSGPGQVCNGIALPLVEESNLYHYMNISLKERLPAMLPETELIRRSPIRKKFLLLGSVRTTTADIVLGAQ